MVGTRSSTSPLNQEHLVPQRSPDPAIAHGSRGATTASNLGRPVSVVDTPCGGWLLGGMNTAHLVYTDSEFGDATLRLAVAAYLARYNGQSRRHTESDLRCYLSWCRDHDLNPLQARRPHVELYSRWMQEVQRFQPSTVSRRLSVLACFYRTCVIDAVLEHSPAEHVRRPHVSADSPTLGFSHLQFEALLSAARDSINPNDFALVAMLGLLGLRIFEATGADATDLSEVHGHRVLTVLGKGDKLAVLPLPPAVARAIDGATQDRVDGPILRNRATTRMSRHSATRRLRNLAANAGLTMTRMHPHMLRHTYVTTMLDAGVDLRDVQIAARHADPRTTMRYDRGPQEPRPTPQLHPRRLHGVGHLKTPSMSAA
jgi:integrase/recombinase XerD